MYFGVTFKIFSRLLEMCSLVDFNCSEAWEYLQTGVLSLICEA